MTANSHLDIAPIKGNGHQVLDGQGSNAGWQPTNGPLSQDWEAIPEPSQVQDRSVTGDDWAFLENLGDPTDEFYTMDNSFRLALQKQFDTTRLF